MKKVSFIITGLVSLMLVGCGGSEGSVGGSADNVNTDAPSISISTSSLGTENAYIPEELPAIPALPAE